MRRNKVRVLKHVPKKFELHNKELRTISKNEELRTTSKKMNYNDALRIYGKAKVPAPQLSQIRRSAEENFGVPVPRIKFIDYGKYDKILDVDCDVVFCVSSFNRYEKLHRILTQIFSQETKYSFKFILMNDGSVDKRYIELQHEFPDIVYLENNIPGGKLNYWKTINILWNKASEYKTHAVIQLDDDFILCNGFLDMLLDKFFEVKEKSNNYMIFSFHLYSFDKNSPLEPFWYNENEIFVDGGMLIDVQFMKKIDYALDKIAERVTPDSSTYTWVRVKERLIEFGMKIFRFKNSLVWHDGNDDSKLHGKVRHIKRVYTKNYIDNNNAGHGQ